MGRMRPALAVAVMMVAMVSCASPDGDDSGPVGPAEEDDEATADAGRVRRAVEATIAVERARVEMQTAYSGLGQMRDAPAGADDVRMVQRAAFDRPRHRARAEGDMSELAAVLETTDESVPGDYSLPTRFLIDGDSVYAQIGPMARVVGLDPATWIRRDLDGFVDQSIENETAALLLEPLGMLGLVARPVSAVTVVGPDEVRDVATTHLTATVDLGPSVSTTNGSMPDEGVPGAGGDLVAARFRAIGVDTLPVDVWIGDDDVVRRMRFGIDAGNSGSARLTTTFDVYDVGEPIDITLPDAADIVDQADLQSRLGS
jgi:hypothetical protein